jgi:dTDP-4-amino-4,6-dideoxygalactose transaminase
VLDRWNERRRAVAALYLDRIRRPDVVLPFVPDHARAVWHIFAVRSERRDALQRTLAAAGIETLIHYPIPPFEQPAYAELRPRAGEWPIAARLAREMVSLPIGPHLPLEAAAEVAEAVNRA